MNWGDSSTVQPLICPVGIYSEIFPTVLQDLEHAKDLQETEVVPRDHTPREEDKPGSWNNPRNT